MFSLSEPSEPLRDPPRAGYKQAGLSPVRVLLDAKFTKEATIPYFMRLKRGYELANQV